MNEFIQMFSNFAVIISGIIILIGVVCDIVSMVIIGIGGIVVSVGLLIYAETAQQKERQIYCTQHDGVYINGICLKTNSIISFNKEY